MSRMTRTPLIVAAVATLALGASGGSDGGGGWASASSKEDKANLGRRRAPRSRCSRGRRRHVHSLERPSGGRVMVGGADVDALGDRELAGLRATAIGFVVQQCLLIDRMSALDNVAQGLLTAGQHGDRYVDLS
jgi:hypothetical protein